MYTTSPIILVAVPFKYVVKDFLLVLVDEGAEIKWIYRFVAFRTSPFISVVISNVEHSSVVTLSTILVHSELPPVDALNTPLDDIFNPFPTLIPPKVVELAIGNPSLFSDSIIYFI